MLENVRNFIKNPGVVKLIAAVLIAWGLYGAKLMILDVKMSDIATDTLIIEFAQILSAVLVTKGLLNFLTLSKLKRTYVDHVEKISHHMIVVVVYIFLSVILYIWCSVYLGSSTVEMGHHSELIVGVLLLTLALNLLYSFEYE